jgi:cardiolipin synthase
MTASLIACLYHQGMTDFSPAWIEKLVEAHWLTLHSVVVLAGLAVYAIGSHTFAQRRHPSAAIAWMISLALLPYVALPLYLVLGNRKQGEGRPTAVLPRPPGPGASASMADQLAAALDLPAEASFSDFQLHEDGAQARTALLALIEGASQTLDLCSFIFAGDVLGREVAQAIAARARAGVKVRLLIDGAGYYLGKRPDTASLARAGVQVAFFMPPFRAALTGHLNLRNHRKLAVADGTHLWCGGRNIAAEYFCGNSVDASPWTDLSFDLRGELAAQGQTRFAQDWAFTMQQAPDADAPTVPTPDTEPGMTGRMVASGPDQAQDTIHTLLLSGCYTARSRILAVTPYFVPDPPLLMALILAARRGVKVDLLLPRHSNHRLADLARPSALRDLSAAGAQIWLAPGMVHAKCVVIDGGLALAGSANLDGRSLFLNYELMVAFYDRQIVDGFAEWIERRLQGAARYHARKPGLARELTEALVRWVAFQL